MPEVAFYVLASAAEQQRYLFACKLVEKVYRAGSSCYVLTDTDAQSIRLDALLWTFRPGSFIPHQCYDGELPIAGNVILIGALEPPEAWQGTLINLSSRCPSDFERFERILEILDSSEETKAVGRDRYRRYQQSGIMITTHKFDHQGKSLE